MTMPSILAKIGEDRYLLGAILLALLLVATSSSLSPGSLVVDETPRWEDYGRLVNLDQAPPFPAFLFRLLTIVFLTLLLAGLAINLQGLVRREWRVFSPGEPPRVPWGMGPVVKLAIYFIALCLFLLRLEKLLLGIFNLSSRTIESWLPLGNAFFQFALLLGLAMLFLNKFRSAGRAELSQYSPPPAFFPIPGLREFRTRARQALRGYICFFPLLLLLILLAWGITRLFDLPWQSHPLVQPLLEAGSPALIWPLLVVGVVLGPLAEEIFFRGLLFPALAKRIGVSWSVTVTAALFATLHFNWAGWIPIFGLGVLLARGYSRTGSLLVPIFIHSLHNALFLAFTILVYRVT